LAQPEQYSAAARQAARDDLEEALAWAARELGDHYTIAAVKTEDA
jgi:hypothetical protein